MRKFAKNKKAFTLVEVLLAIAIILVTMSAFFALILVVMKSHANVVATNDVADFAMLNARAFENTVINAKTVGTGDKIIGVSSNKLCVGTTPLCDIEQYKVNPGPQDKWKMDFSCKVDENGLCEYTITLTDNFVNTSKAAEGLNKYKYVYKGSVYIPHAQSVKKMDTASSVLIFSDYE